MSKLKEEVWVTRTDDYVIVGEMDLIHCRNTLRMLIKQIRTGDLKRLGHHQSKLQVAYFGMEPLPEIPEEEQLRHMQALAKGLTVPEK